MPAAEKTRSTPADDAACRRGEVLLHHLGQDGPKPLLCFPPVQDLDIKVRLLGISEVLLELIERRRAAGESASGTGWARCCERREKVNNFLELSLHQ